MREGGCVCGPVRFSCDGEPINMRVCRCRTHQKPVGARFFARALFPQTTLAIAGESASYPTSQMLERLFCKVCGSHPPGARFEGGWVALYGKSLSTDRPRQGLGGWTG